MLLIIIRCTFSKKIDCTENINNTTITNYDMNESDPRSDVHYLGSSENKA